MKQLIFCFSHAGGNAQFYNLIKNDFPPDIQLIPLEYAGHGIRMHEKVYDSFEQMTTDLHPIIFQKLEENPDANYSFFGYSMGSIAAFVMLQELVLKGIDRLPTYMFLGAHQPHRIVELDGMTEEKTAEWCKNRTIAFGAVPQKLINNKAFWRTYLPMYKADYKMIAAYDFEKVKFETKIPAAIFYSETDTPIREMRGWERYFKGKVDYAEYKGTHFFISGSHREIAETICRKLNVIDKE